MGKKLLCLIVSILFVVNMSGCVALLAGAAGAGGTTAWLSGKLVHDVNTPFDETVNAARLALKALGLRTTKQIKKDIVAQLISEYTDGKTIWIDIHKTTQFTSRIEVRVGVIGDKEAARKILNKILGYLKTVKRGSIPFFPSKILVNKKLLV